MADASVIGAGQSPFGSFPEESYLPLFEPAFGREFDVAGAFLDAVQYAQREMGAASMASADWQQHGLEANR